VNMVPQREMDSKFRLITIAAKRCEQLHRGARPKFDTASKKWAYVALEEVRRGLIDFEIIEESVDTQVEDYDSDVFLEGDMAVPLDIDPPQVIVTDNDDADGTAPGPKKARAVAAAEEGSLGDVVGDIEDSDD
jgi:DNA-directed RNA polymerase omega subunit